MQKAEHRDQFKILIAIYLKQLQSNGGILKMCNQ